jgi:hypothetical protein
VALLPAGVDVGRDDDAAELARDRLGFLRGVRDRIGRGLDVESFNPSSDRSPDRSLASGGVEARSSLPPPPTV